MLGRSRETHLAEKVTLALVGLLLVPATTAVLALGGANLPLAVPLWGSLLFAAIGFWIPDVGVHAEAQARRRDFRHALGAFLDQTLVDSEEPLILATEQADSHTRIEANGQRQEPEAAVEIEVRVLGDVQVIGATRPLTEREPELVAFLATREQAVDPDTVQTALWPQRMVSPKRWWNIVADTRSSLGTARNGEFHFPLGPWARLTGSLSIDAEPIGRVSDWRHGLHLSGNHGAMTQLALARDGTEIAFDTVGHGPEVVLVHGITESRGVWAPIVERLVERHRVISVDLRGHGESQRRPPYDPVTLADDVAAVAAAAGCDRPALVGHSLGGAVVTLYAAAGHDCRCVLNVDQSLQLPAFKAALEPLTPMLLGDDTAFRAAIAMLFTALDGSLPAEERARIDRISSPERDVVLGVWAMILDSSEADLDALTASMLGSVTTPYLALHGTDPGDHYEQWLRELIPSGSVEAWPDLGHYPHLVEPDRFVERLEQLLATTG